MSESELSEPSQRRDSVDNDRPAVRPRGFLSWLFVLFRAFFYTVTIIWAIGAILYDGPAERGSGNAVIAVAWTMITLTFLGAARPAWKRFLVWVAAMAVVAVPWFSMQPSNDRNWLPPWKETAWAEIDGDTITFHNFRNFDYTPDGNVTERWEDRTIHLSKLQGLDYFHDAFSGQLLAHPILSFDFGEDGHVAFSIEARRQGGEEFTPVGGLYRMFELSYLVGDERDFIRERASVRNEPVRLYRATYSEERIREMFLDSLKALNELREKPRFYNSVTANCTNSIRAQAPVERRAKFDYRILMNGRLESLLYERGAIVTKDLPLDDLVKQASINEASKAAFHDEDWSDQVREGLVGFE